MDIEGDIQIEPARPPSQVPCILCLESKLSPPEQREELFRASSAGPLAVDGDVLAERAEGGGGGGRFKNVGEQACQDEGEGCEAHDGGGPRERKKGESQRRETREQGRRSGERLWGRGRVKRADCA